VGVRVIAVVFAGTGVEDGVAVDSGLTAASVITGITGDAIVNLLQDAPAKMSRPSRFTQMI
jgi:hypothetical protein